MSEIARVVCVDRLKDQKLKDFLRYMKRDIDESKGSLTIKEVKYIFKTLKEKRIFVSSDLNERYIVYCLIRFIKNFGFIYSEVDIGGWETGIALFTREMINEIPKNSRS